MVSVTENYLKTKEKQSIGSKIYTAIAYYIFGLVINVFSDRNDTYGSCDIIFSFFLLFWKGKGVVHLCVFLR